MAGLLSEVSGGAGIQRQHKRRGGMLEPTLGRQIAGGLITGARNDMVAGPIINLLVDALPGIDQDYLDLVESSIDGKPASTVAKFIGEFGVLLPQLMGIHAVGRLTMTATLRAAALAGAKRGAVQTGKGQLGKLAIKATDIGGDVTKVVPKLAVERAAEIVGGNAAVGGYFGVQAAVDGASPREALESAAFASILGGTFETGVAAIGLFTKAGRSAFIDQNKIRKEWATKPIGPKGETAAQMANKVVAEKRTDVTTIRDSIHKLLDVDQQIEEMVKLGGRSGASMQMTKTVTRTRKPSELSKDDARFYRELLSGTPGKVLSGARGAKRNLQAARRLEQIPRILNVTRRSPFSHAGKRAQFHQMTTQYLRTPESWHGELGETLGKLWEGVMWADNQIVKDMALHAGALRQMRDLVTTNLKLSKREIADGAMLRYASAFEKGDVQGLKDFLIQTTKLAPDKINQVAKAFDDVSNYQKDMYNLVLKAGGRAELTEAQLASRDVKRFLTHIGENMDEDDMIKVLTEQFGGTDEAWRIMRQMQHDPLELDDLIAMAREVGADGSKLAGVADIMSPDALVKINALRKRNPHIRGPRGTFESRMPKFGAFDFSRTLRGTLEQKKAAGLPVIVDPFDAALRFSNAASRRHHLSRVIGTKGEILDDALEIAQAEGANTTLARNVMSEYLDNKYYNDLMRSSSKFLTGVNVASKMTLGVLANMSQTANTLMTFGMKNLVRGFKEATVKEQRVYMEEMLALNHSMMTNIGRMLGEEGLAVTGAEKVAEMTLKYTGFSAVERINRIVAGSAGYAAAKDIVSKGAMGRLRGNTLDKARRQSQQLGFDLDDMISKVRAIGKDGKIHHENTVANLEDFLSNANSIGKKVLDDAAFLAAQKTQFIPSKMRRPLKWNHPLGRIAFQFKTFALQQGRLIRDQVFGEAAAGNVAPLAYFMSASPIAGELVGDMKAFVKGEERTDNLADRAIENLMYLGGFGLLTDLWQSTVYGDFSGALLGPTFGTVEDFASALANLDGSELGDTLVKLPVFQAAHAFYRAYHNTPEIINKYIDLTGEADTASSSRLVGRGLLTFQDTQGKREDR